MSNRIDWSRLRQRQRQQRFGSESVNGDLPRELYARPRAHLSKAELRTMAMHAMANTPNLQIKKLKPKGPRP